MSLSNKFAFKKRRIYEVIDVFTVIGVTVLLDEENFLWIGFNHVSQTIQRIGTNRGVYSSDLTLNDIFCLSQEPISIQSMTEDIIFLFIAIERRRLNIIEASKYISHGNGKEKTTRCKISQAVAILELANIIRKTENQSEYELLPEFYITVPKVLKNSTVDPSNIQSLLNWTDDSNISSSDIISFRRKEFYTISHE
ncbi:hypothetical protein TVAG_196950 [Trichomonas vaginalis G3]|uniref:E2F/DP family winged-helix DNA-binding domain-containing protein n=1 Tax=Trichomonas vaginalis (strain ATCC PRA-98 / G3) TaxID=412133 RepID=A2FDF2_TRIV3|nr:hypothetical protein TVAGG3_0681610 [Trichomonas vaginalis G3]EAX97066.1 hypothetical protein TVAG_196950 [Trichomonas vaginalis G3]KAI5507957.1 hypothetical protein TVAGG3_0681610 [Trichomonas vaginalis G3]|eukprot:XP_001309996.1 hypothetical protein [Trichomonas vaginalis G3]